jgi:hypothetical protein
MYQDRKCRLVPAGEVVLQELGVGYLLLTPSRRGPTMVPDDLATLVARHVLSFPGRGLALTYYYPLKADWYIFL